MKVNSALVKAKSVRYFRTSDYNRSLAITKFVRFLERRAEAEGIKFKLLGGSIKLLNLRLSDDDIRELKKRSFERHARFIYGNKLVYIQYNSNMFFETSYINVKFISGNKITDAGTMRIFNDVPLDMVSKWDNGRNIHKLFKHLVEKFDNHKWKSFGRSYDYIPQDKPTLYLWGISLWWYQKAIWGE